MSLVATDGHKSRLANLVKANEKLAAKKFKKSGMLAYRLQLRERGFKNLNSTQVAVRHRMLGCTHACTHAHRRVLRVTCSPTGMYIRRYSQRRTTKA